MIQKLSIRTSEIFPDTNYFGRSMMSHPAKAAGMRRGVACPVRSAVRF